MAAAQVGRVVGQAARAAAVIPGRMTAGGEAAAQAAASVVAVAAVAVAGERSPTLKAQAGWPEALGQMRLKPRRGWQKPQ